MWHFGAVGHHDRSVLPPPLPLTRRPLTRRPPLLTRLLALLFACLLGWSLAGPPAMASTRLDGVELLLPIGAPVTRAFDAPLTKYSRGHRGVDLAAEQGTTIRAAASGRVAFAGMVAGRPVITISHGHGVDTTYEPVSATVKVGSSVRAGEALGTLAVGNGAHDGLHWGLRRAGVYYDPMLHLMRAQTGPVRLLPWSAQPKPPPQPLIAPIGLPVAPGSGIPVSGPITSPYGMRLHPVLKVWKLHDGVDFGAACGVPVRSVGAGRVVTAHFHPAYGNWVVVDVGGGRRYGYAHLSRLGVAVGAQVAEGQSVGLVGTTGYSTGCHLHFMAWQGGQVVNPWR